MYLIYMLLLSPLAVQSVSLSQFELQDLLCRQKVHVSYLWNVIKKD